MAKILLTGGALVAAHSAVGATTGSDPYTAALWGELQVPKEPERVRATARPSVAVVTRRGFVERPRATLMEQHWVDEKFR